MIQISAAQETLRTVGRELMRNHLKHCVAKAVTDGPASQANAMYEELLELYGDRPWGVFLRFRLKPRA